MMFKNTKHMHIGEEYKFSGSLTQMSKEDKILEDGTLVYHYKDKYQKIPKENYTIVHESSRALEKYMEEQRKLKKK